MSHKPEALSVEHDLLESIYELTKSSECDRVDDNLLGEFKFKQLQRDSDKITDISKRWLVKAILQLNYDRNSELALNYFNNSVRLESDIMAWTHFPAALAERGYISLAFEYLAKAVEAVPCKATFKNLSSLALDTRNICVIKKVIELYRKMYINDEPADDWVEECMAFVEDIENQSMKLGIDNELVSSILLRARNFLATLGYKTCGVTHYFDDARDEAFSVYKMKNISQEEIATVNEKLADFMVENDYLDAGVVLAVAALKE